MRSPEKVGGKRRMTDEEDGDDMEDGRWTRRRTEQEREEKEWHAWMERILVRMDTWEKWRAELDEQQMVLGRSLVAGVDWVGELLEGVVELLRRRVRRVEMGMTKRSGVWKGTGKRRKTGRRVRTRR